MELTKAVELAIQLADTELKHLDYDRVVQMAKDNLAFISGEGVDKMLRRFTPREDKTMFEQRVALTQHITPAVCNSLITPFRKVGRNDKVKKRVQVERDKQKQENIIKMQSTFFGDSRKQGGLDYWLKTRFLELSFADPNSWLVIEWLAVDPTQVPEPYPVEVTAEEALNFDIKNGVLNWLFAKKEIQYLAVDKRTRDNKPKYKKGVRYILYDTDFTVVLEQVDKDLAITQMGDDEEAIRSLQIVDIKGNNYLVKTFTPNLGYNPAMRVGYVRDIVTKGRTFTSPLKAAEPYLRKSIKTVSELDLTMTLHAFPQKIQYVDKCPGESPEKRCFEGKLVDGSGICGVCNGSGKKVQTSAQDAILLPMPEQGQPDVLNLDNMLVYKAPPVDLIRFQKEYTDSLKLEAHIAVFNSQAFVRSDFAKTATEVEDSMESVYDTLEPFTDKVSELWVSITGIFANILGVDQSEEGVEILHRFPADPKLKTTAILLNELKLVNESSAPDFLRDSITDDIASLIYNGDPLGYKKYECRKRFFPFNGKSKEEVAVLLNSSYIAERTKVLAANFDLIMSDAEKENPGFSIMSDYNKQWEIVEEIVDRYLLEIQDSKGATGVKLDFGSDIEA